MKQVAAVSIRMVAERAGVSPATVSNVLTGKLTVSRSYVDRVRAAAEELGYVGDRHASRLRSGRHSLAGVVVPDLGNPMFGAFVSTLERCARADDFDLLVVSADNDPEQEAERLRAIRSWRPAGLIVIPTDGALAQRVPEGTRGPVVVADRIPDEPAFDLVAVDNTESAGAVTAHLAAQGLTDCLVCASTLAMSNVRERWEGARSAAGAMAVELLECGIVAEGAGRRIGARLAERTQPDAVFALDHQTALVAYRLLAERRVAIPADIAFASFDDAEWMGLVAPGVSAVRQPVQAMAEAAWAQLMRRLSGAEDGHSSVRLPCTFEIRGSTLRKAG